MLSGIELNMQQVVPYIYRKVDNLVLYKSE